MEVIKILLFFLAISLLLFLSEMLRKRGLSPEGTRKFVHVGVGVFVFLTPLIFKEKIPLIILSAIFVFINGIALIKGRLGGIHSVERETMGTVLYPLSVILIAYLFWGKWHIFYPSLSGLIIGDAAAQHFGGKIPIRRFSLLKFEKSLGGSLAMAIFTYTSGALFLFIFKRELLIPLIVATLFATFVEFSLSGGADNLFVPISISLWLLFFERGGDILWVSISFILSSLIAFIAYKLKTLTFDGAIYTLLLGFLLMGMGGIRWIIPILIFFSTSSFITKMVRGKSRVKAGEARDSRQVLANGGLAGLFLLFNTFIKGKTDWFLLHLAAIAVVTSDTWSTEIGALSRRDPRALFSMKRVPKGSSGAISTVGSLGGIAGAFLIGSLSIFYGYGFKWFPIIGLIGSLGNFMDSVLGATLEVQYLCERCGGIFDVKFHCNSQAKFLRGFKWFGNNLVNFSSSLIGALIAFILMGKFK
jgi:uncharacterized protein (TIGR00297 family)